MNLPVLDISLEKAMAPHSSTLAWKIPWTEEPGGLQPMGLLRVGHDWATSLSLFTFMHWRRKWQPTPVFLPGESQGRGSLVRCHLWGHTESDTVPLKRYSYILRLAKPLISPLSSLGLSCYEPSGLQEPCWASVWTLQRFPLCPTTHCSFLCFRCTSPCHFSELIRLACYSISTLLLTTDGMTHSLFI